MRSLTIFTTLCWENFHHLLEKCFQAFHEAWNEQYNENIMKHNKLNFEINSE